jgi:biopolymer transport protein ExbD
MTGTRETGESVMPEINITPFTDVLLVLLIIFMILASLAIPPGFERTLQQPGSAHRMTFSHAVPVVITQDGRIRFNGVDVSQNGLYAAMNALHEKQSHARIALYADARARYGLVIRVLDAAKAAGITDVSFVTE